MMKTATSVQENAGDILAEAKQINEDRAAEAEAEVVDDYCEVAEETEEAAETAEAEAATEAIKTGTKIISCHNTRAPAEHLQVSFARLTRGDKSRNLRLSMR